MAPRVVHATVAAGTDAGNGEIHKTQWNEDHTISGLATVAGTGAYSDLTGTPTIPNPANPSASVGLTAVNGVAVTYMRSDGAPALDVTAAYAFSGLDATRITANGSLSSGSGPAFAATGTWITGGTTTTTKPYFLIEPAGTSSAAWMTAGTAFGINAASGFVGELINLQLAGVSQFRVDRTGTLTLTGGSWASTGNAAFLGGIDVGGTKYVEWTGRTVLRAPADGSFSVANNAEANNFILTAPNALATPAMQLGVNSATPIAQIIQGPGSRAGTDTNTAGASITFDAGKGTGTGTPSTAALRSPVAVASGTGAQTMAAGITANVGTAVLTSYTVATLPAAATAGAGATAFVTDANTTIILGLGLAVTGGGANKVPVYSDGTNWLIG